MEINERMSAIIYSSVMRTLTSRGQVPRRLSPTQQRAAEQVVQQALSDLVASGNTNQVIIQREATLRAIREVPLAINGQSTSQPPQALQDTNTRTSTIDSLVEQELQRRQQQDSSLKSPPPATPQFITPVDTRQVTPPPPPGFISPIETRTPQPPQQPSQTPFASQQPSQQPSQTPFAPQQPPQQLPQSTTRGPKVGHVSLPMASDDPSLRLYTKDTKFPKEAIITDIATALIPEWLTKNSPFILCSLLDSTGERITIPLISKRDGSMRLTPVEHSLSLKTPVECTLLDSDEEPLRLELFEKVHYEVGTIVAEAQKTPQETPQETPNDVKLVKIENHIWIHSKLREHIMAVRTGNSTKVSVMREDGLVVLPDEYRPGEQLFAILRNPHLVTVFFHHT